MLGKEKLQELRNNHDSYSFQKVEGLPVVLVKDIVTQDYFKVGDKITLFNLPNGQYFASRALDQSEGVFTIGKITPSHIYFDDEITVEEG